MAAQFQHAQFAMWCGLQGTGYLCLGTTCQRQCSVSGKRCIPLGELSAAGDSLCGDVFARAGTRAVCVVEDDSAGMAAALSASVERSVTALAPNTALASTANCQEALLRLACFSAAPECDQSTDVQRAICADACAVYKRDCGLDGAKPSPCEANLAGLLSADQPCTAALKFRDMSEGRKVSIIVPVTLFSAILLLFAILWCYCAWATRDWLWCCHRRRWRPAELTAIQAENAQNNMGLSSMQSSSPAPLRPSSSDVASPRNGAVANGRAGTEHATERGGLWRRAQVFVNPLRRMTPPPPRGGSGAPLLPTLGPHNLRVRTALLRSLLPALACSTCRYTVYPFSVLPCAPTRCCCSHT